MNRYFFDILLVPMRRMGTSTRLRRSPIQEKHNGTQSLYHN